MRASQLLLPTVKEDPAGAEAISHKLMVRAGLIRQLAAGIYVYLPAGWRVMRKIEAIIREEMEAIGCQELLMPVLNPAEIWQESGRWSEIGEELFRLKDRKGTDMALAMTHEEVVTWLAAREVRSYKQLPQLWYHIQTKERDEARPKSGILRTREFIMKDSYSLDTSLEALQVSYDKHIGAYDKIFSRSGLDFLRVQSDPGMMGGKIAHEYMAFSDAGEDEIVFCRGCGYAANVELAVSSASASSGAFADREEISTPGARTIAEVSDRLGLTPDHFIKSLCVISAERGALLVLLRGDHELQEGKLRRLVGEFRMASAEEVAAAIGVETGFVGPLNCSLPIIADEALRSGTYVGGANKPDCHVSGITAADFEAEFADLHAVVAGESCAECGETLSGARVIEIGNIFQLGTKYSKPMGARYLDEQGVEHDLIMGSYGIGVARIAAAVVEQHNDADGIIWPASIAPFEVHLCLVRGSDDVQLAAAEGLYSEFQQAGIDVLYDERTLSPGVKFKDADLLGCPVHVVVGKHIVDGLVEVKIRSTGDRSTVPLADVVARVRSALAAM